MNKFNEYLEAAKVKKEWEYDASNNSGLYTLGNKYIFNTSTLKEWYNIASDDKEGDKQKKEGNKYWIQYGKNEKDVRVKWFKTRKESDDFVNKLLDSF